MDVGWTRDRIGNVVQIGWVQLIHGTLLGEGINGRGQRRPVSAAAAPVGGGLSNGLISNIKYNDGLEL